MEDKKVSTRLNPRDDLDRHEEQADVVLIGGGIMSATLGSMLAVSDPTLRIIVLERFDDVAAESSGPWNNAGTGHSGFCELNYMPDPTDRTKPAEIARQYRQSLQWWAHLVREGLVDPTRFIHQTPHLNVVFGTDGVDYLRARHQTLSADRLFDTMEFTDDPAMIEQWAPLLMDGREPGEPIAATRQVRGTDVDFGALTRALLDVVVERGGQVRTGHEVRGLRRRPDGGWTVRGTMSGGRPFDVNAQRVFVGAGGFALHLLQKAKVPEVRGYAVLPVGAAFFRTGNAAAVARHDVKVYGQAERGAPPMSVPHLDRRFVGGRDYLMFGPYATFSTKLLKKGSLVDFFTTLRWHNLHVIGAAMLHNVDLVRYLVGQLSARPKRKFAALRRFWPNAEFDEWELAPGGQRAQLVKPHPTRIGDLQQGTELVVDGSGTIAGLLGASPGASTAVSIMADLVRRTYPADTAATLDAAFAEPADDLLTELRVAPDSGPSPTHPQPSGSGRPTASTPRPAPSPSTSSGRRAG
ncbi:malate:quinone oxidoreductase [Gordonia liuliyuniae]|uniref:malate:quinone oxidoreductase n=1 Tax=Gordonia liuliyuniae TaxID=2911517 RepID=UPI0027E130E2|nr:malate:quinone oxidoreductase [Gordonia liuliyuniae]